MVARDTDRWLWVLRELKGGVTTRFRAEGRYFPQLLRDGEVARWRGGSAQSQERRMGIVLEEGRCTIEDGCWTVNVEME